MADSPENLENSHTLILIVLKGNQPMHNSINFTCWAGKRNEPLATAVQPRWHLHAFPKRGSPSAIV